MNPSRRGDVLIAIFSVLLFFGWNSVTWGEAMWPRLHGLFDLHAGEEFAVPPSILSVVRALRDVRAERYATHQTAENRDARGRLNVAAWPIRPARDADLFVTFGAEQPPEGNWKSLLETPGAALYARP